jgi:glycosidase
MRNFTLCIFVLFVSVSCKKPSKNDPGPGPQPSASIGALSCTGASGMNPASSGQVYSTTITVPYTGGNGISYSTATINSTGVTGLTATLQSGTLANGAGNFTYSVSGTPVAGGSASFNISFGALSCSVSIPVTEQQNFVQYGTPYAGVTDRQDATIYQVNMRAFGAQSNFQGVIARLDSIKALGANVIYLMPIYPVGAVNSVNSPYAVKDYRAINTEFGTLADLRALVDGAHSKNMSVILDWVANHTAWDHQWITDHRDWYLQNGSGTILSPPGTGWNDVAQLNFSNAAMRFEMIRNLKYWIYTANVDGYRFDYADGPPMDFWKQAIDTLRNITTHKLLLMAEGSRSDHFTAGFDFTFGFGYFGTLKNIFTGQPVTNIDSRNTTEYVNASNGQQVVRYLTNHDVNGSDGTPQELFGGIRGSMAAFVVTAYMKSVPMIYNGQEVGFPTRITFPFTSVDINWTLNPDIKEEYKTIIAFRNTSAAIRRGSLISYNSADVAAFTKELGAEKVFVLSNLRNGARTFTLPAALVNTNWTNAMTGAPVSLTTSVNLAAYEYLVLKN